MLSLDNAGFELVTEGAKGVAEKLADAVIQSAQQHPAVFLVGATVVATTSVIMLNVKSINWGSFSLETK